jgi:phosphoserine phosphatase
MNKVLTLIVNPLNDKLSNTDVNIVVDLMKSHACDVAQPRWLAQEEAVDIAFSGEMLPAYIERLADSLNADFAIQEYATRAKKMLIADMDSTMITEECIDELADFAGLKDKVSAITEAAMRGELDFNAALSERVGLLKGMKTDVLEQCYRERINLMPGAMSLVKTMNANGALTALVSGGFTFFTSRIAARLGFALNHANVLNEENGALAGTVKLPICNSSTKLESLITLRDQHAFQSHEVLAVGDGANDIPMIEAAGLGIAYHAKPKARAAADVSINHSDLSALLFIQGYSRNDFIV